MKLKDKKCWLVELKGENTCFIQFSIVFEAKPNYRKLLNALSSEGRALLARDKESVKFDLGLATSGFSIPLFKNNLTGREKYKDGFSHRKNLIGRLTITEVKLC